MWKFIGVIILFLLQTGNVFADSIDCRSSSSRTEITICEYRHLYKLDRQMSRLYSRALRVVSDSRRLTSELREDQRHWLVRRDRCRLNVRCIGGQYKKRIRAVQRFIRRHSGISSSTSSFCRGRKFIVSGYARLKGTAIDFAKSAWERCVRKACKRRVNWYSAYDRDIECVEFRGRNRRHGGGRSRFHCDRQGNVYSAKWQCTASARVR
ncbi:MAG: lysozyme inhibitor LprI family protein [Methyloligellaceae bacterium]